MISTNRIFNKLTNTKKSKINVIVIKLNRKGQLKYWSKLKKNKKSMVYKPHMLTQNIIRFLKS